MYKTIPLQLFATAALLGAHNVEGFLPAPSIRGHIASASGRGATCSQGVKPLQAGAMGEDIPEEDKIKARAAFADSSLMDNLMNMLNQLKGFGTGGTGEDDGTDEPAEAASSEGETAAADAEVKLRKKVCASCVCSYSRGFWHAVAHGP